MALEQGPIYVDTLTCDCCAVVEALTSREIQCSSVLLLPGSGDTVSLVDIDDNCKTVAIPAAGITLPVANPATIMVQGACGGETLNWIAV